MINIQLQQNQFGITCLVASCNTCNGEVVVIWILEKEKYLEDIKLREELFDRDFGHTFVFESPSSCDYDSDGVEKDKSEWRRYKNTGYIKKD